MYTPNLLALLVAGIIPMAIGSLWYGPLFGGMWMKLVGKTEEELRESLSPIKMYVIPFIMALFMAFVLAHVIEAYTVAYEVSGIMPGLQAGFWMWVGFILTFGYQAVAFENKKIRVYALSMGYNLLSLLAMGGLLGIWR